MEDLLQEPTNDLTRRAIDLTYDFMQKDPTLSEDQAVDKVIMQFRQEGIVTSRIRSRRYQQSTKSGDLPEDSTVPTEKQQGPMKDITDKGINVSKYMTED